MFSEVAGSGAIGLVIGYDVERNFAPPILGATAYAVVSTIALGSTSYWFAGINGAVVSIIAEFLSVAGRYLIIRKHFGRMTWI
jgi:hypothetical protein